MLLQGSLSIERMCQLVPIRRRSFYRSLKEQRPAEEETEVRSVIQQIALEHRRRYGYRRITAELRRRGLQVNHKRVVRIMRKDNLLALQPKPCLVKIGRAFELNNIQRDVVTCDIDEIQLSRSFGEGQRWGSSKTMRVPASVAISSNETAIPALDSARHAVPVAAQSVFVKVASALERFQLVDSMQYLLYPSCNEGRVD